MKKTARAAATFAAAALAAMMLGPVAAHATPAGQQAEHHAAKVTTQSSFTGTILPGAAKAFNLDNIAPIFAYAVGLSPQGASTTERCELEVTRSWYTQRQNGEHEFHFLIKNIGDLACGAEILIRALPIVGTFSTGGVDPGDSVNLNWNNANPLTSAFLAGLAPFGATDSAPCSFEVTRSWYLERPSGEREFWLNAKNVGSIACSASVLIASHMAKSIGSALLLAPGASVTKRWNNATPLDSLHIVGMTPFPGNANCKIEVTRTWYEQVINPPAERELYYTVKNVGAVECLASALLATVAT
jgi:hypothetical protein